MRRWILLASIAFPTLALAASAAPPAATKRPVTDTYWGQKVSEDYRWLEDWNDPAVHEWSEGQNARARAFLDSLPMRKAVLARVDALTKNLSPSWSNLEYRGGTWFAIKNQPPKQQPLLVRLGSLKDAKSEHVILDPNVLDPSGATTIDFLVPSWDGKLVAVSLSKGGTESGTIYVYETATGRRLDDEVPGVQKGTGGGSVAWNHEGTGFWRTRYAAKGERPDADLDFYQQVYFHRLGTPADKDEYVIGKEFPKIAEIALRTSEDGRWVLADVSNGDGGDHAIWVSPADPAADGAFHRLADFDDRVVLARFGGNNTLYLLSRKDAPNGKVLVLHPQDPLAKAQVLVPEGDAGVEWFTPAGKLLYVEEIVAGPSRVEIYDTGGRQLGLVPIPSNSLVSEIAKGKGDEIAVRAVTWTHPPAYATYVPSAKALAPTALATTSPARFDDIVVSEVRVRSTDNTEVPLTILMKKGTKLDGTTPTLLTGYGGYGISQRPSFVATRRLWFDQGGILAVAHTRGGGEFGDAWHRAGNLTRKQNVFNDFAACAQYLVGQKYTNVERLACQGGSNGGLLMGAMITQHPDLFRAVVTSVGIYDMLRVEQSPNGLFNITEFGTVKDSAQFRALYAYSPYHRVTEGTKYPAVLFTSGGNDPRVDPMQSRKMAARLQAANASDHPILLRTDAKVGHGIGSPLSARNELSADIYSFVMSQLGMKYKEPAPPSMKVAQDKR